MLMLRLLVMPENFAGTPACHLIISCCILIIIESFDDALRAGPSGPGGSVLCFF